MKKTYKTIGVLVLGLVILSLFFQRSSFAYAAVVIGILSYSSERMANLISDGWMHLGKLLGKINAGIILTVLFLFVVLPIALLKRIFGAKKIMANSTWSDLEESIQFKNPW